MPTETTMIDFSDVPASLEGKWVVYREADHVALGYGDTPREALEQAQVAAEDPGILLARIPGRSPIIA